MNPTLGILILMAVLCMPPCIARADNGDLEFSCVAKKVEQKATTASKGAVAVNTENWVYVVTLENKTFKDIANLEIKYLIFYKQEELGSTAGPRLGRQAGSVKVAVINGNDKAEFNTVAVQLQKATLEGFRYYANGASPEANASLYGLWIRIYQNENMIAEMSKPANLPGKEKWEE